jgi:hypothetical protein
METIPTSTAAADEFKSDSTTDAMPQSTSEDEDAVWSILSNAFFVCGGFIYVIGSTWDYSIYSTALDPDNLDLHSIMNAFGYFLYQTVWIMGPLVYFLNSIIDVKWALIVKARDAAKTNYLQKLEVEAPDQTGMRGRLIKAIMSRLKRNVGSRRTLGAASLFGLGAIMGLLAAILNLSATDTSLTQEQSDNLYAWGGKLGSGSVHTYFLSAVAALWKPPSAWLALCKPFSGGDTNNVVAGSSIAGTPWHSSPRTLFTYGDILFGTAATIDVLLADFSIDDGFLTLPILSSVLWTVDALLYLRGDYCTFYLQKSIKNDASGNAVTTEIVSEMV